MIVPLLLMVALAGAVVAIVGTSEVDTRARRGDIAGANRAYTATEWGATAAVFFLVLALLIWAVQ